MYERPYRCSISRTVAAAASQNGVAVRLARWAAAPHLKDSACAVSIRYHTKAALCMCTAFAAGCINDVDGGATDSGCNATLPLCEAGKGLYGSTCGSKLLWGLVSFVFGWEGGQSDVWNANVSNPTAHGEGHHQGDTPALNAAFVLGGS